MTLVQLVMFFKLVASLHVAGCTVVQAVWLQGCRLGRCKLQAVRLCRLSGCKVAGKVLQAGKHRRRLRRSQSEWPGAHRPRREQGEVGGIYPGVAERFKGASQRHSPDPRGLARIVKNQNYVLENVNNG